MKENTMNNQKSYYMILQGETLVFFTRDDSKPMPSYDKVGELKLKDHAPAIYEAARKKKLKFHA